MNRKWALFLSVPMIGAAAFIAACGDDDNALITKDAGLDSTSPTSDGSPSDTGASTDANDGAVAEKLVFTTVASFSGPSFELPEGVVISGGAPIVGFAPQGRIVRVLGDGGTEPFATFAGASQTYVVGLALDPSNNVYAAIAQTGATPVPAPGIYKIAPDGGTPVPLSVTGFGFPNGLDFIGTDLYVGDSTGKILKVDSLGNATVWKSDPELVGGQSVCMSQNGFDIGVNGIAHDDTYVYGVNLDKGSFFRIKRDAGDGGAGSVEVLYKNCDFFGADGVVRDSDGTFIVANNGKNRIDRVTVSGTTATWKTIGSGAPLDGPASVFIEGSGNNKKLWVTNSAFGSAATDGGQPKPSLVSAPLK